ncbi:hypothetical protein [Streptomyces sp. NPDC055005]
MEADGDGVDLANVVEVDPALVLDPQATVPLNRILQAPGLLGCFGDDAGQIGPDPCGLPAASQSAERDGFVLDDDGDVI